MMTKTRKRKLLFRLAILFVLCFGIARGLMSGYESTTSDSRASGFGVRVDSNEIGVRLDSLSGELAVLAGAGYHLATLGMSEVFRISRSPHSLVFGEEGDLPALKVRSADGSGFHFKDLRVSFRVSEGRALDYLSDSGIDSRSARQWVGAMARPILREEFGTHSIQEVTDALVCDAARGRAFDRLEAELVAHGIELLEITASKPSFDRNYEVAIAKRKVAGQEVERLGEELKLTLRERDERLIKTESEIISRDELMDGELQKARIEAGTAALGKRGVVDTWALKQLADGEAEAFDLNLEATTIRADGQRSRDAFALELAALEGRGEIAVRERLVQTLAGIRFKLTPFAEDPTPTAHTTLPGGK